MSDPSNAVASGKRRYGTTGERLRVAEHPPWWTRRIGIENGRNWHIRAKGRYVRVAGFLHAATLCGKAGKEAWSPSWRNLNPDSCRKCEDAWWDEARRAHPAAVVASPTIFNADHYYGKCFCGWRGPDQQQHEKAKGDAQLHFQLATGMVVMEAR